MKARIEDIVALRAVSPAGLAAYVRAEGWEKTDRYGDNSDVYVKRGGPELILPDTDALADYAVVVSTILRLVANFEERDELQVYRDLVDAESDVIRVRAPATVDDGSIQISTGVDMFLQARELLLSAACAAKDPRASYRAGKAKDAAAYMNTVRLGQTEQSSFVVTLLAPVPPNLAFLQGDLWPVASEEPFERRVTQVLTSGLLAAHNAAEKVLRGDGYTAFKQVITNGVNANLCDSLGVLLEQAGALEVSVTWAKTRPAPDKRLSVKFSQSRAPIFREAARYFRSIEPRQDERLEGYVVSLGRGLFESSGHISLKTFVDEKPASVKITLDGPLYRQALQAHDNKTPIALTGELVRKGQRWELEKPENLEVIDEDAAEN
jgi:hypothetical protein